MEAEDIDTYRTDNLVCPHCGYIDKDSWEMPDSSDKAECPECGKTFAYDRQYDVTYTSQKIE
jgi:hypothetical protein